MTVTRGNKHTFECTDIKFNNDSTAILLMDEYISECIKIYSNDIKKSADTPWKGDLFNKDTHDEAMILN